MIPGFREIFDFEGIQSSWIARGSDLVYSSEPEVLEALVAGGRYVVVTPNKAPPTQSVYTEARRTVLDSPPCGLPGAWA